MGYILGGRDQASGAWIAEKCKLLYSLSGADECRDIGTYLACNLWDNHDVQPYGLYTGLVLLAFISILTVFRKTTDRRIKIYVITSTSTLFFSSLFLTAKYCVYTQSAPRYLLPAIFICIPNICIFIKALSGFHIRAVAIRTNYAVAMLALLAVIDGVHANLFDSKQPLPIWNRVLASSYEELRDYPYAEKGWKDAKLDYMDEIKKNGITKVGIWEEEISGVYPMLHALRHKEYEVQSIYGIYGSQHLNQKFKPEAIIYIGLKGCSPAELTYMGQRYMKKSEESELPWNDSASCLYILMQQLKEENPK